MTNDGIGPGGNISAIVYEDYLGENGWPMTFGVNYDPFFTEAYYRREQPVWESYAPGLFSDTQIDAWLLVRLLAFGISAGVIASLLLVALRNPERW